MINANDYKVSTKLECQDIKDFIQSEHFPFPVEVNESISPKSLELSIERNLGEGKF